VRGAWWRACGAKAACPGAGLAKPRRQARVQGLAQRAQVVRGAELEELEVAIRAFPLPLVKDERVTKHGIPG
jgi:hypothetical protein